ncbi:MAG: hypothetical protein WKF68_13820 [Daejeonella sp.]
MNNYEWLDRKTPRSVDQLKLWPENPRLTPGEHHLTLADYAEDITSEDAEKIGFFDLAKAIAKQGFIPFDPIVVWQNPDNEKFYVAEGNRRVLILKLLRNPDKAPRQYRGFFRNLSLQISKASIAKVMVNVAPSFDESIWYINQRNNNSSLQRSWGRVQQQRWVSDLYTRYNGDLDIIKDITNIKQGELESIIRILKVKDFVSIPDVQALLDPEIREKAISRNFPITIIERILTPDVRDRWGLVFNGTEVEINSNKPSFYILFADLIKRIVLRDTEYKDLPGRITTRTVTTHLDEILGVLPQVNFEPENVEPETPPGADETPLSIMPEETVTPVVVTVQEQRAIVMNDPNRTFLIPDFYLINTTNHRLNELFVELQKIRMTYKNCIGASLRVLLDLAFLNYINNEGIEAALLLSYHKRHLREITLKKRIEYIKTNHLSDNIQTIAVRLLNEDGEYSLDVLNGYIHGTDIHYLTKPFLNQFWNFLFPLMVVLLDIREKNV